ncbi:MAG: MoxR family ATPase [Opitutae bacterium]|nr:MoxR family ATPase [Opitutae bacterium]MBX3736519.1 MoxR family ATPase [Candidatus Didemnitutus sp.]
MNEKLEPTLAALAAARREVAKVIIGQSAAVELALITILTRQHALLEGVPGVAKTLLVRTLAHVLGAESGRVQFTPDLMPADITGTNIFNLQTNQFTLVRGPVFTTFMLADEINRAPAKTQAALLQAMQERCVTIDRETHALDPDFTVFATQNPAESEGTYPLPEAQKDRFMFRIQMACPARDDEISLARRMLTADAPEAALARGDVQAVLERGQLATLRASLDAIAVRDELMAYIVDLVRATRTDESVLVGAGPRATQSLLLGGRAKAAIEGRDYVTPDDIRQLAPAVLAHRIVLRPEFEIEGLSVNEVLNRLLEQVAVPR